MKVFVQGMRRSGTTILFDVLCQDGRFDPWYEPFGPAKGGHRGGGSGVQDVEFSERTRVLRERLAGAPGALPEAGLYNWGAPRDAALELETDWPEPCLAYLRAMLEASPWSVLKFVRAAAKLRALRALAPEAKLVHVVRDPRRVALSQLLSRERIARGVRPERFFARRDRPGGLWASRALSQALLARPGHSDPPDPSDVERVLLVWRHLFRLTHDAGREAFGDAYRLVRHEDLGARPRETVAGLYAFLGLEAPEGVLAWAERRVHAPGPPPFAGSPEWRAAFARLKMEPELREAGYADALDAGPSGGGAERGADA